MARARPSLRVTISVLLLLILSSSEARRTKRSTSEIEARNQKLNLTNYHVPLSNGSASLPPPDSTLVLKSITLGRGTQNYTCAPGSTSPPVAVGAVAKLLDVGPLLPLFPPSNSQTLLNQIPAYLLSFDLSAMPDSTLPHLGTHYFDAAKVPTFDLGATGKLKGKKGASIAAPKDACKGTYGAVDWLQLTEAEGSVGLKLGYRVYTAGGKAPPSCAGQKENIEVQYAAQYWFFGPPSP